MSAKSQTSSPTCKKLWLSFFFVDASEYFAVSAIFANFGYKKVPGVNIVIDERVTLKVLSHYSLVIFVQLPPNIIIRCAVVTFKF